MLFKIDPKNPEPGVIVPDPYFKLELPLCNYGTRINCGQPDCPKSHHGGDEFEPLELPGIDRDTLSPTPPPAAQKTVKYHEEMIDPNLDDLFIWATKHEYNLYRLYFTRSDLKEQLLERLQVKNLT
jgi:hypothetical protein